jgi:hypothetical protein
MAGADKLIGGTGRHLRGRPRRRHRHRTFERGHRHGPHLAGHLHLGANVENLAYTGALAFTGTGNALDNTITGGNKATRSTAAPATTA